MLREHRFAASAHRSVCQRIITLGMLLIKEPELSSGVRARPKPACSLFWESAASEP